MAEKWQEELKKANTRFDLYRSQIIQKGFEDEETNKLIRHQICGKIREFVDLNESFGII